MAKLKNIKTDCFEPYYLQRLSEMRAKETACLASQETLRTVSEYFINISIIISVLLVLTLQKLSGYNTNVNNTFTIVSIINSLRSPLHKFRDVLINQY